MKPSRLDWLPLMAPIALPWAEVNRRPLVLASGWELGTDFANSALSITLSDEVLARRER